jgi:predicted ATP-dependent endonuclease of OLD family
MKLTKLHIQNFRGYQDATIRFDNVTTLIGKNDIGKSTVLEALEIFFNAKGKKKALVKLEQDDLNIQAAGNHDMVISIDCSFSDLPKEVVLDSTAITNLQAEGLINNGELTIRRKFNLSTKTPKEVDYFWAKLNQQEVAKPLLGLKHTELTKIFEKLTITEEQRNEVDARSNVQLRATIRSTYADSDEQETWLQVGGEDGSAVYDKINEMLPIYALFQSDRMNSDNDDEITNPIDIAVNAAMRDKQDELNSIVKYVREKVQHTMDMTLFKLAEIDPEISKTLTSTFEKEPNFSKGFASKIDSDSGIPINKRGSGVRRLILLAFFRAQAESDENESDVIYAFEEPETSQHPDNQRMLIESFIELANKGKQVILTTHTPFTAELLPLSSIRFIHKDSEDETPVIENSITKSNFLHEVINDLGVSSNGEVSRYRAVLLLEGPQDVRFFRQINDWLVQNGDIPNTLEDDGLFYLPVGGCGSLKVWAELDLLVQLKKPWFLFMDSDQSTPQAKTQLSRLNMLKSVDGAVKGGLHLTRKREIENYLTLKDVYPQEHSFSDNEDVKKWVKDHANEASIIFSASETTGTCIPHMSLDDLKKNDKYIEDGIEHHEIVEYVKFVSYFLQGLGA